VLDANSPLWSQLRGGYRTHYDPRPAIQRLEDSEEPAAWDELWEQLHHQGDVGEASYAAVPLLVGLETRKRSSGWRFLALLATIEIQRHSKKNPPVPEWLSAEYGQAWQNVVPLALSTLSESRDPLVIRSALAVVALAKGQLRLGALLAWLDTSEIEELTDERLAWAEVYRETAG
jgi:hypothetical protein